VESGTEEVISAQRGKGEMETGKRARTGEAPHCEKEEVRREKAAGEEMGKQYTLSLQT